MQPKAPTQSRSPASPMAYYAHTAEAPDGTRLPESSGKWQPLSDHLRNVADLAAKFAAPFNASDEARPAGLLHDLGKYSAHFQARIRDPAIHGINQWAWIVRPAFWLGGGYPANSPRNTCFNPHPSLGENSLLTETSIL